MTDEREVTDISIEKKMLGAFIVAPTQRRGQAAFSTLEEVFRYIRSFWGTVSLTVGPLPPDFENVFKDHQPELISVVDESGLRQQNAQLADNLRKAEEARDVATREFKRALVMLRIFRSFFADDMSSVPEGRLNSPATLKSLATFDALDIQEFLDEFKDVT